MLELHELWHLRLNVLLPLDDDGSAIEHLDAAKVEAVRIAGQLLFSDPTKLVRSANVTLSVSRGGTIVYEIKIAAG